MSLDDRECVCGHTGHSHENARWIGSSRCLNPEWKAEGNRPLPLNIILALLRALIAKGKANE